MCEVKGKLCGSAEVELENGRAVEALLVSGGPEFIVIQN